MRRPATPADAAPVRGVARIGISGWRYPPWRGTFYPDGLPQRLELAYAAERFTSIELNGSFYSLQTPQAYARWHADTPPGFVFAVKGPRYVTHMLKLRNARTAVANFLASGLANLREKLGPLLWQLPPQLAFDPARLDAFLALLPRNTDAATSLACRHDHRVADRAVLDFGACRPLRHALEVRHPSFVNAAFLQLMRFHGVAIVVADTAGRWPFIDEDTADFVYARLHGDAELYVSGYTRTALGSWATRIDGWLARSDVYCYFDNDVKVRAPIDAQNLRALVEGRTGPWARRRRAARADREQARPRARP